MTATKTDQVKAVVEIINTVYDVIAAHPNGVPSGELYAHLMGHMTIHSYQQIIGILEELGKITVSNHYIRAVKTDVRLDQNK